MIAVSPRIYRDALAFPVRRARPDAEVRVVAPEAVAEEVADFGPHLLVRSDTDGLDPSALAGLPCWVEVKYGDDGMDARIGVDGRCLRGLRHEPRGAARAGGRGGGRGLEGALAHASSS